MANLFTSVLPQQFYPRLTYSTTTVDFMPAATALKYQVLRVGAQQVTYGGNLETQVERLEHRISIAWAFMEPLYVNLLRTYVMTWGLYGRQAALVLDRNYSCEGQYEFDVAQSLFTKAELLNNPFDPSRVVLGRGGLYQVELVFRQGS